MLYHKLGHVPDAGVFTYSWQVPVGDDPERLMVWFLVICVSADMSQTPPRPASDTTSQVISANEGRPRRQDAAAFITLLFSFRLITDAMKDERGPT